MTRSKITIDVEMDENRIPSSINWNASETTAEKSQKAKAMMLSFWDGTEKTALRIDLWTKDMMVDEMADFYYQTLLTMADSYGRATADNGTVDEMRIFARELYRKFKANQLKENKA